jgi:hypothetical protein
MLSGTVAGDAPTTSRISLLPQRVAAAFLSVGAPPSEVASEGLQKLTFQAKAMKQRVGAGITDSPPRLGGVGVVDLLRLLVWVRTGVCWSYSAINCQSESHRGLPPLPLLK